MEYPFLWVRCNFCFAISRLSMSTYSSYFGEDFMNQDLSGSGSIYGETVKEFHCRYSGRVLSGGGACRRTGRYPHDEERRLRKMRHRVFLMP